MIHQEFNLVPAMTVAENITLGREPVRAGFVSARKQREISGAALQQLGIDLRLSARVGRLSVAGMQMVEIAKAVSQDARIVVMDEPSAALTEHELEGLYRIVRRLREEGRSVLYVSHRLEEVFALCDRVTVLRDGAFVATVDIQSTSTRELVRLMVGRELSEQFPARTQAARTERLVELAGVSTIKLADVSLQVHAGEILGIGGLVGSGRSAVARAIVGIDPIQRGELRVKGDRVVTAKPRKMIRLGIGYLTEDRKRSGLVMPENIRENASLAALSRLSSLGFVRRVEERQTAEGLRQKLNVRARSVEQNVGTLSGGNQQKVLLARWLWRDSDVLIVDEPTRGIDVGAKAEIYRILRELADRGVGILMISSEMPELLGLADRIIVMRDGRAVAEFTAGEATQEGLLDAALGHEAEQTTA
jgi:ABC-type sugar transport system ATPase subunit